MEENIIVDLKNRRVGVGEKLDIHKKGLLHRAFSVFVFNDKGELLIQRRAFSKYHSAGLWSNTCCGHPRPGERLLAAGHRRLVEEMGFDCALKKAGVMNYCEKIGDLIENEIDFVVIGHVNSCQIRPNDEEVCDYRWIPLDQLKREIREKPESFTHWFKLILGDELLKDFFGF